MCSTVFLAMVLAALRMFEPRAVVVSTLQAVSGAGYPGLSSMDIVGNVLPHIGGEEEKMETETQKILGRVSDKGVESYPVDISAHCNRVSVVNGHTETMSISFGAHGLVRRCPVIQLGRLVGLADFSNHLRRKCRAGSLA